MYFCCFKDSTDLALNFSKQDWESQHEGQAKSSNEGTPQPKTDFANKDSLAKKSLYMESYLFNNYYLLSFPYQ